MQKCIFDRDKGLFVKIQGLLTNFGRGQGVLCKTRFKGFFGFIFQLEKWWNMFTGSVDQDGEMVHRSTMDHRAGQGLGSPESGISVALMAGGGGWGHAGGQQATVELAARSHKRDGER